MTNNKEKQRDLEICPDEDLIFTMTITQNIGPASQTVHSLGLVPRDSFRTFAIENIRETDCLFLVYS